MTTSKHGRVVVVPHDGLVFSRRCLLLGDFTAWPDSRSLLETQARASGPF